MQPLVHLRPSKGFALITVLVSLATITLLFAAASTLTLTHLQDNALAQRLGRDHAQAQSLIEAALAHYAYPEADRSEPLVLTLADVEWGIGLQDVSGLVDLNTASPELLEAIMPALGLDRALASKALTDLRVWRRQENRLLRVSDAVRVMGLPVEMSAVLAEIATVSSGATGFAPEIAPMALLEAVTGQSGGRDTLTDQVPERFRSPARAANFRLVAGQTGADPTMEVVVNFHQDGWRLVSVE